MVAPPSFSSPIGLTFSAVLAFAVFLGPLACNPSSDTPVGDPGRYEAARTACVARINAFRATENLPPLARWRDSEACADGEAQADALSRKAHSAFGDCREWAQNECPGWGSVQSTIDGCLKSMWDERLQPAGEQGHYRNMSNPKYTQVACGFHETPEGRVWALQNFK